MKTKDPRELSSEEERDRTHLTQCNGSCISSAGIAERERDRKRGIWRVTCCVAFLASRSTRDLNVTPNR